MTKTPNAAVILIGDELLSGRTRDINLKSIAEFLTPLGIPVLEARVVSDDQQAIIEAVRTLSSIYTYVFTTGGIGPTHDDITANSVAAAFGRSIDVREDARAILAERYRQMETEFTEARLRMARIPDGASLIKNPVSGAPGFQLENVFVMAGVPSIARGMLEDVEHRLETGVVMKTGHVRVKGLREGDVATDLKAIAEGHANVSIGSYPWYVSAEDAGISIVVRGATLEDVLSAMTDVEALARKLGADPERQDPE